MSLCMTLSMTLCMSFSLDGHNDNDIIHLLCARFPFGYLIGEVYVQLFLRFVIWLFLLLSYTNYTLWLTDC